MHKLSRRPVYRYASLAFVALMAVSLRAGLAPAEAQAREVTAAVVIPVRDASGSGDPMLGAKMTDALALALEATRSYRVISRDDLMRELKALELTPPLNEQQQLRVGEALQADRVITATLTSLSLDQRTGVVRAELDMRSYNVKIGAVLNGAFVQIETKPVPGWSGDPVPVINEALRELAEKAVFEMERSAIRHGTIYLVDDQGVITTDLGVNDGVSVGTQLLVLRGFYVPELNETKMRPIGVIELTGAQVRLSQAKSVSGQVPRIGDRVYALYRAPSEVKQIMKGRRVTSMGRNLLGLGIILGIVATATGSQNISPPGADVLLYQQGPGATPVVRINIHRGLNPDPQHTHVWLIYRGDSPGFIADATAGGDVTLTGGPLVAAINQGRLDYYEDQPGRLVGITFSATFQYFNRQGEQEDGSVDITYNHPELIPGNRYWYKVRRVVDPWRPILPNPQQVAPQQEFSAVTFTVDPQDALSEPSAAAGPVTYSLPATPLRPVNSTTVNPASATFEWTPARGADQYQVQVYDDTQLTHLVAASPLLSWTAGQTLMRYTFTDFTFPGDTNFYWVVGSRTIGEAQPQCVVGARKVPFVLSTKETFRTVTLPPGPAASAGGPSGRPGSVRGFWRERRQPHP